MRVTSLVVLAAVLVPSPSPAQEPERYLLLAATRTSTMQDEINQAAGRGYRVVGASRTENAEAIVAMEKTTGGYSYRLIATTRTGTLQREISEAADAGYRVVPRGVTTKRTLGGVFSSNDNRDEGELLVLMEKGPDTPSGLAYHVVATSRTGTMQKEMAETADRGFELLALVSRGEHVAIFERGPR
jgi:hypothetical protein